jgi:two-component system sensor histidine kinase/response regulator
VPQLFHDSQYAYTPSVTPDDLGMGRLFWKVREAVIVADLDTERIVLWNPAAAKLFGYSAAEARGLPLEALIPDGLRTVPSAYRDSDGPLEMPANRKTGEAFRIELCLSPLVDVAVDGRFVLALANEVTERKRTEEAGARLTREQAARVGA